MRFFIAKNSLFTAINMEVNRLKLYIKYVKIQHEQMFGLVARTQGGLSKKCRKRTDLHGIIAGFVAERWNTANFGCGKRK